MVQSTDKTLKPIDELCPMWSVITPEEKMYLRENTRYQLYRKGGTVYNEGDTARFMICVISGRIKIFKEGVGGRSQIVRFAKPLEILGYRAAFAHEPYRTNAAAIEQTEAYLVPISVVRQIIQSNNKLATFFISQLAKDLGMADTRIVSLTQKHVRARLAESLLLLRENYGIDIDGNSLNIRLSREDLANYSNMTTSNAIRTLSNFVSERLVNVRGRYISIIDEEGLRKISKMG